MANPVVASWTACIKELQDAVNTDWQGVSVAETADALRAVVLRVKRLREQPPLPHAAWKRLVHDVQVSADSENTKTQQLCSILEHELFVHTAAGGLQKIFSLDV
jgi:hypothetical protein